MLRACDTDVSYPAAGAAQALGVGLLLALVVGCSATPYVRLRDRPRQPIVEQWAARQEAGPSDRTEQILRQYDLARELRGEPRKLLEDMQVVVEREPSAEKLYAFAELSYLCGEKVEKTDEKSALDYYGAAVAYAYLYLFDERFSSLRNPYDPQFRGACDVYNGALESSLRILNREGILHPGRTHSIATATQQFDVTVVCRGLAWRAEDFERFEFVSDYDVAGLANQYRSYGLGVPLIAVRKTHPHDLPSEKYYPPGLSFPVTAFLRLLPDDNTGVMKPGTRHRAQLELYDPLVATDVVVGHRRVPLESDLSTPLAYFLNGLADRGLNYLDTVGLLQPARVEQVAGMYMLQPYEPGKIPVVLVHGLWSSPLTWTEMFNDLRSVAEIRNHYQIWFYLYPTGQPFWTSATQMRDALARIRDELDPQHREPALDQMVLVGHSMGGLVSRLQTINSRDDFWHIASNEPFQRVKAEEPVKEKLSHLFYFQPSPSVRRVVTIATPHRGSKFANQTTRYLAQRFIALPRMFNRENVVKENPGVFRDTSLVEYCTSLDSLAPESPILPVMLEAQKASWVRYHNIVGVTEHKGKLSRIIDDEPSDGVVAYASAHLEDVVSEIVVDSEHSQVHRHPRSVLEVRRILLDHLAELRAQSPELARRVRTPAACDLPPR